MRPPPQQQQQQQPTVPAPPPGLPTLKQRVDAMRLAARFHLRRRRRHHPGSRSSSSFSFTSSMSKNQHHDHHNHLSHDTTKTRRTILPTTVTSLVRGCLLPRGGAHCRRAMNVDTGDKKEDHGSWSGSRSSTTRSYQVLVKWLDNAFTTTNRKKTTIPTMISFLTGVDHQHDHHCHEMDHPPRPYSKVPVGEGLI